MFSTCHLSEETRAYYKTAQNYFKHIGLGSRPPKSHMSIEFQRLEHTADGHPPLLYRHLLQGQHTSKQLDFQCTCALAYE